MSFLGGLALLGSTSEAYANQQEKRARIAEQQQQLQLQKDAQEGSLAIGSIPPEAWGGAIPGVAGLAGIGQQPPMAGGGAPGGPPMPAGGTAGAAAGIQPPPQQSTGGAPGATDPRYPGDVPFQPQQQPSFPPQPGAPVSFNYPGAQDGGQQNPLIGALQQLARGLGLGAGGAQPAGYTGTAATGTQPATPGQYSPRQVAQVQPDQQPQQPSLSQPPQGQQPQQQPGQPGDQATQPWQPGRPIQTMADLAGAIRQYNPGITPRAFSHAMSIGMKLLGQEAQAEYMRARPGLQQEAIDVRRQAVEAAHPGAGAFQDWLIQHPHASPEEVGSALTQFTGKAQILAQRGQQAQALEAERQTGRSTLETQKQTGRETIVGQKAQAAKELEGVREMDRENLARLNADSRAGLEKQKEDYATANYPFGRSAEGMTMYLYYKSHPNAGPEDYWAAKAKYRPETAGQVRQREKFEAAKATAEDLGDAIDQIISNPDVPITGIGGQLERMGEWFRGVTGMGDQATPATDFQGKIRMIQQAWPQSFARRNITNAQERAHIDEIIAGLGRFTSRQQAINLLRQAQQALRRHSGVSVPDEEDTEEPSGRDTAQPIPTGTEKKLKPLDDAMKKTIIRLNQQGWEASEIRAYVRKHGYDPGGE